MEVEEHIASRACVWVASLGLGAFEKEDIWSLALSWRFITASESQVAPLRDMYIEYKLC